MPLPPPHNIVVIGAGFAGLRVALELRKRRARIGPSTITLVDANPEHLYTPLLYEVAMGCLESSEETAACALREGACMPYAENPLLHRKDGILRFVQARVESVNWEKNELRLAGREPLPFDGLILAVGGETATFGVPGVLEHAVSMKTLEDALTIRRRIARGLQELREGKRARLDVVVVGGGPNGCEGAGELARYMRRLVREGVIPKGRHSVTLVEAGSEVLGQFSPPVRAAARRRLGVLGVEVMTGVRVQEIKKDGVVLPDRTLPADVTVWAGGMKPREAVKEWGFPVDEKGFVQVDGLFGVQGKTDVWALGDCAFLTHPVTGARVPAMAQAASKQAGVLAENVARRLERKPTVAYVPPARWNTVVPIGGSWAVADMGFMRITGLLGYACRKVADLGYFTSVLPFGRALPFWWRGLKTFLQND